MMLATAPNTAHAGEPVACLLVPKAAKNQALDPAGYTGSVTTSALAALLPGAEDISARELVLHHAGPVRVTAVAGPGAAGGEVVVATGATEAAPLRTVGPGVVASRVAWQAGAAKLGGRARLRLTTAPGGVVYAFELV